MQPGDGQIRPAQVQSHDPRKHHPHEYRQQRQGIVLFANYLVVEAEDVLSDEPLRRGVVYRMCRYVVHRIYLNPEICLKNSTTYDPAIAALPASSSNCQNPPANTRRDRLSCCSAPGRTAGCRRFHTCRSWWQ